MRRIIIVALSAALVTTAVWLVAARWPGPPGRPRRRHQRAPQRHTSIPRPRPPATPPAGRPWSGQPTCSPRLRPADSQALAGQLARARLATARYATSLRAAKAAGYQIITRMIPDMGWHFLNPTIQGFDVTKPPILVYERRGDAWQLAALEWVSTAKPSTPPPGRTWSPRTTATTSADCAESTSSWSGRTRS